MRMTSKHLIGQARERLGTRYSHLIDQTIAQWENGRLQSIDAGLGFAVVTAKEIAEGLEGYASGSFCGHERCLLQDNSLLVFGFDKGSWSVVCNGEWESCWPFAELHLNDDDARILDARFFGVELPQLIPVGPEKIYVGRALAKMLQAARTKLAQHAYLIDDLAEQGQRSLWPRGFAEKWIRHAEQVASVINSGFSGFLSNGNGKWQHPTIPICIWQAPNGKWFAQNFASDVPALVITSSPEQAYSPAA